MSYSSHIEHLIIPKIMSSFMLVKLRLSLVETSNVNMSYTNCKNEELLPIYNSRTNERSAYNSGYYCDNNF